MPLHDPPKRAPQPLQLKSQWFARTNHEDGSSEVLLLLLKPYNRYAYKEIFSRSANLQQARFRVQKPKIKSIPRPLTKHAFAPGVHRHKQGVPGLAHRYLHPETWARQSERSTNSTLPTSALDSARAASTKALQSSQHHQGWAAADGASDPPVARLIFERGQNGRNQSKQGRSS